MVGFAGVEEVSVLLLAAGFLLVTVCGLEVAVLAAGEEEVVEGAEVTVEELAGSEESGSAEELAEESKTDPTEPELKSGETGICCPPQPESSSMVRVTSAAQSAKVNFFMIIFILPLFPTKINYFRQEIHWQFSLLHGMPRGSGLLVPVRGERL